MVIFKGPLRIRPATRMSVELFIGQSWQARQAIRETEKVLTDTAVRLCTTTSNPFMAG